MRIVNVEDISYENLKQRIYLPSTEQGGDVKEYLYRYVAQEFPWAQSPKTNAIYSIPRHFQKLGERQASLAEQEIFSRLKDVETSSGGLWMTFFHSASYAGHSFRNHRVGRLMIREHDFVVFARHKAKLFVALMEVKSTNDQNTNISNLEKTSDAKVIKNNKRSAQHQLRDHLEVLNNVLFGNATSDTNPSTKIPIQSYIMWPFLGAYTKDPKQQTIKRWKEDHDLHVFEDTISDQNKFNQWFCDTILAPDKEINEAHFNKLLNRFILLSCGVFVDEIDKGMMALLTQDQRSILNNDISQQTKGKALVVHGPAGTGKTILVLKKLEMLHQNGELNEQNRALIICYWPGIRCEIEKKLDKLGIRNYVDTSRYYISLSSFLEKNHNKYKHIFMDEAEALCLSFSEEIVHGTLAQIYSHYHDGNCDISNCPDSKLEMGEDFAEKLNNHPSKNNWGELWFMVDINQASIFLPKHSPNLLKTPAVILSKVMRSTGYIFNIFKQFYTTPMPLLPKAVQKNIKIPSISMGHHIAGPPIYWVDPQHAIDKSVANLIIDLCSTKGIKPNDICVIPFLVNDKLRPENLNKFIDESFVENSFRPQGTIDVEYYVNSRELNNFLVPWVLRVKGLEFKVVIMAIDDDDFDCNDHEDRKKAYIIASRCTSMLIIVSNEMIRTDLHLGPFWQNYPFSSNL